MKIGAKVLVQGEVISLGKVEEDTYAEVFFNDGSTAYVDVKDFKQSENNKTVELDLESLVSTRTKKIEEWFNKEMLNVGVPPKNKTNIALNINSLISELKIEVPQSDNNKSLSVSQKDLSQLENQLTESLLKCVSGVFHNGLIMTTDANTKKPLVSIIREVVKEELEKAERIKDQNLKDDLSQMLYQLLQKAHSL
ncbi:hypothetical protein [Tenacibaculum finnmarkense]|uniref:hypothetical protein n=1 Tax=Tenacibaculum finnmarkense TaxID=2781243 RepID=UPI001E604274|nr:hypothetical protein [Tenacibaculum finnmarkense]MCD8412767.1 hypothetical protein [Tenacibaculum finnmarkense genomovar ulcerans]MCG8765600.1 hypothetical protein [Tenacibaculum finnmarkense]MCG8779082.1 hypothetical protein [Tenacibaculum finnmarkense]